MPEEEKKKEDSTAVTNEGAKEFLNGWTAAQEDLMSSWSDIAICYRWLHFKSERIFHSKNQHLMIPILVMSVISGSSSLAISSVFEDDTSKKYATFAIGGVSLFTAILTAFSNQMRYAQSSEAHRVAGISWGKFQRLLAIELALHPDNRTNAYDFLKICRAELDRLIEQSPSIPNDVVKLFEERFGNVPNLKKPDVCGALEHTTVFESSEERLKQLSIDTAFAIKQKRAALTELVSPEVQESLKAHVALEIDHALEAKREQLRAEIETIKQTEEEKQKEVERITQERRRMVEQEMEAEKKRLMLSVASGRSSSASGLSKNALPKSRTIPALPLARIQTTPPLAPLPSVLNEPILPPLDVTSTAPPNIILNPLFDRGALVASPREPARPPHPPLLKK